MINLLPADNKKQLRASAHNRILSKYIVLLLIGIVLAVATMAFVYLALKQSQEIFRKDEEKNNQRIASYSKFKEEAQELSRNINQTKSILAQRVDYSKVLFEIAKILPKEFSISSIRLESKLFEGNKQLEVNLQNPEQAPQVKQIFEESNLFKLVSIDTVINTDKLCIARYTVVFNREGFGL